MKTRKEKIEILDKAVEQLKKEFVGLDNIIDEIKESILSWYVTPEIVNRPVVISLWGMTGTGKSSVVRRLMELLDLSNKTLYFDCGKENSQDRIDNISDRVSNLIGLSDDVCGEESSNIVSKKFSPVFVFDEFQYARTIDEMGKELDKPSLRPVWSIIDSGILDLGLSYSYAWNKFLSFLLDLTPIFKKYPNMKIESGIIKNKEDVKIILDSISYDYPHREIPSMDTEMNFLEISSSYSDAQEKELDKKINGDNKDPYRPLRLIPSDDIRILIRKIDKINYGDGNKFLKDYYNCKNLEEVSELIENAKERVTGKTEINVGGSLVFIIGNLDEAYKVQSDTNPDMDADTFYEITSKVTITDIKNALKRRFRAEQVARFGNNMIKYPTLGKKSFEKIIKGEVSKIITRFNNIDPIQVGIEPELYSLLYSEGVFPTQGVRPVFTTIETILTPFFSKILIEKDDAKKVTIGILDKDDCNVRNFKVSDTTITLTFDTGKILKYPYHLQLGSSRDPKSRGTRFINSVHESGHAIIYAYCTGEFPKNIVSVSTDRGGFCSTFNKSKEGEIDTRHDIDCKVMIGFGGYEAEKLIYGDRPEMCLMGSGSDIRSIWSEFTSNALYCGYFEPISYRDRQVEGEPDGFSEGFDTDNSYVKYFNGTGFDTGTMKLRDAIEKRLRGLMINTYTILVDEKELLCKMALYLGKYGAMNSDKMSELVEKYGNKLTPEFMKKTRENYGFSWYLSRLKEKKD